MVRRLSVDWPDARPFRARDGRPVRWLAVSDDRDPALSHASNRDDLGPLDAIVGCGDLEPDYIGFLADAFGVRCSFVRGNHDRGGSWEGALAVSAPRPLATGRIHELSGLSIVALEWPGLRHGDRRRHDGTAWADVIRVAGARAMRRLVNRAHPMIVLSHAPPRGIGDREVDPYHVGFSGYRWLLDQACPPLWLHGHVPPASVDGWRMTHHGSEVVNVTGAVLIEIHPPAS